MEQRTMETEEITTSVHQRTEMIQISKLKEVKDAIRQFKTNKVAGEDSIAADLTKMGSDKICILYAASVDSQDLNQLGSSHRSNSARKGYSTYLHER